MCRIVHSQAFYMGTVLGQINIVELVPSLYTIFVCLPNHSSACPTHPCLSALPPPFPSPPVPSHPFSCPPFPCLPLPSPAPPLPSPPHALVVDRVVFVGDAEEDDLTERDARHRVLDADVRRPVDSRHGQQAAPAYGLRDGRRDRPLAVGEQQQVRLLGIGVVDPEEPRRAHLHQVDGGGGGVDARALVSADRVPEVADTPHVGDRKVPLK